MVEYLLFVQETLATHRAEALESIEGLREQAEQAKAASKRYKEDVAYAKKELKRARRRVAAFEAALSMGRSPTTMPTGDLDAIAAGGGDDAAATEVAKVRAAAEAAVEEARADAARQVAEARASADAAIAEARADAARQLNEVRADADQRVATLRADAEGRIEAAEQIAARGAVTTDEAFRERLRQADEKTKAAMERSSLMHEEIIDHQATIKELKYRLEVAEQEQHRDVQPGAPPRRRYLRRR